MAHCWHCGNLMEHGQVDFCTSHCSDLYYAEEDNEFDEDADEELPEWMEEQVDEADYDPMPEGMIDHDDEDRTAYYSERLERHY